MKYQRYPAYKESGVEWIGEIPDFWFLRSLKYAGVFINGSAFPLDFQSNTEDEIPFFKVDDLKYVDSDGYIYRENNTINLLSAKTLRAYVLKENSVIFAKIGQAIFLNRVGLIKKLSCIDNNMLGFEPSLELNVRYALFYFSFLRKDYFVNPGALPSLSVRQLRDFPIPILKLKEQVNIVHFLDKKIGKINLILEKIDILMGLLKEKRKAIITNAVTKGLDPNVPMKDSGVEWIGEIPEHWNLSRIKFVSEVTMGQSPSSDSYLYNGNLPFLQGCAEFGEIFPNPKHYCEVANKTSRPGDILLSVRAPVGEINLSDRVYGIGRGLCSIRPLKSKNDYLKWYLFAAKNKLISISNGSTYDAVAIGDVKNVEIPISMVEFEQNAICEYLNTETSKIDSLIVNNLKLIDLLKEYKYSIITQAVTGKIDVRGLTVPVESNSSEA